MNIDLKKTYSDHYRATADPAVVDVPSRLFLTIDGVGDPNTAPEYVDAIEALYPIAYGLRAAVKAATGDAYVVMPLEGLWWTEDMNDFDPADKSNWKWTMMICLPDTTTASMIDETIPAVTEKKNLRSGGRVRADHYKEGCAAQILHVGVYAEEAPNIVKLHAFIAERGGTLVGKHHEIYLSDPRKTAPEKLRTIIRQPFADA